MSELAMFLEAAAAFGDEALPPAGSPSCVAPAAARSPPPRAPSSAAPAMMAAAPPDPPAADPWGVHAAQVAACAPGGACAAPGATSHSALDAGCLSLRAWEPFGGAGTPARVGGDAPHWSEGGAAAAPLAEAGGAAGVQPASGSEARSVREQMAELEQGLHAILAIKELYSAPPANSASAEPACAAAEGPFERPAYSAGAAQLPASPPGGSALAAA